MAQNKPPHKGPISRIESEMPNRQSSADKIKKYYDQQVKRPVVKKPSKQPPKKSRADQYRPGSKIPKFLRAVKNRIGSGHQSFKLPGTDYLVKDMRGKEAGKGEALKDKSAYEMKDGKLTEAKKKSYENYLAGREMPKFGSSKETVRAIKRLLSEFEKLLVERFEKGKTVAKESEDGKPHFKSKTGSEWRSFFSKFVKRTLWRKAKLKAMSEFMFRGLVDMKKGNGKYAMLIGDMAMSNGQVEKFARLRVLTEMMAMLSKMEPGSNLEAEFLRRGLGAEDFRYLALAHKHGEGAIKTGTEATKGMFGELKMEEQVAEQLGLKRRGKGKKGYKGPIKWGEEGAEEAHSFVPWGFWEREKRAGKPSLMTAIMFTTVMVIIIILAWVLVKYLL